MHSILINDMDHEDLNRKISGSVVRLDGKLIRIERVRLRDHNDEDVGRDPDELERGDYVFISGYKEDTNALGKLCWCPYHQEVGENEEFEFDLAFPDTGYVNYKGGSLYVTRQAARQWKMGLHPNCTVISDKFRSERAIGNYLIDMGSIHNNLHFLSRVFVRKYMTYNAVVGSILNKERIGGAINKYIYIGRSAAFPHMVICYKDMPVGYVDRETLSPYLFHPAEYVQSVLTVPATIKESINDITIRTEWD